MAAPTFDPAGGALLAPVKVTIRCATPDAAIHVTLDGKEPTPRDLEVDTDSSIVVDEPLTLRAKAWLPDGSVSPTTIAAYALRPVTGNGASFVEQSAPALMAVGRPYRISVVFRNIGTQPWTPRTHFLAPHRSKDAITWHLQPVPLTEAARTWVAPTFVVQVTAPAEPGTYNLRFRMQGDGKAFGEPTPVLRTAVVSAEEYEREIRAQREMETPALESDVRTPPPKSVTAPPGAEPLGEALAAQLEKAKRGMRAPAAQDLERLVRELQRSPRSFKYLRTIGFAHSDEEFARLVAEHAALFRPTRIVRRDERGTRIIPGWPGVTLKK